MALSGVFLADFKSFTDATAAAVVSMKSMEGGGAKVEANLARPGACLKECS